MKIDQCDTDFDGCVTSASCSCNGASFRITYIYALNVATERKKFFSHRVTPHLALDKPNILARGFNYLCLEHQPNNPSSGTYIGREQISALALAFDLVDLWRLRNPGEFNVTWRTAAGLTVSRLDKFYTYEGCGNTFEQTSVFFSNHDIVQIRVLLEKLRAPPPAIGRSFWKLNTDMLEDDQF